jgi:exopolyphosphatase/guanosine-5'-triphosphate,3'-diphosphate pyrophosphatase
VKERYASVDVGTNSTRMLLAEVGVGGEKGKPRLLTLERRMVITRLGEGVDASGRLGREGLARTRRALQSYSRVIESGGPVRALSVVGTSAARDAANAGEFTAMVRETLEAEPRVLSGDEEALLSFTGATYDLPDARAEGGAVLVIDIGGGSTELVLGQGDRVSFRRSVDVGCVRMSERHLAGDPPLPSEISAMRGEIAGRLRPVLRELSGEAPGLVVGLAGTVTTLAGMRLGLREYDGEAIHGSRLGVEEVRGMFGEMARRGLEERKAYMGLEPGRADIILGGAAVLLELMEGLGVQELLVSEKDILDGLVIEAWRRDARF